MEAMLKTFIANPLVRARIIKAIRGASMAAGAWALTSTYVFITTHFKQLSAEDATAIATVVSTSVGGLVLTIGSAIYSQFDVSNVNAKVTAAAATGTVEAASDPAVLAKAKEAIKATSGSPDALLELKNTLAAGKE